MSAAPGLRTRFAIRAGALLLRALAATWRVRLHGWDAYAERHARGGRVVLVLWHGQMLACIAAHRLPIAVMVSEHRDGEIIARVLAMFGFGSIRGSSSRGGVRVLLEAVQALDGGSDVAITPDGPRGPRHSFAPGALALAFRAGAPIVALTARASSAWVLGSWDRFEIPKPFARIDVLYSEPQLVVATTHREASSQTSQFAAWVEDELANVQGLTGNRTAHSLS